MIDFQKACEIARDFFKEKYDKEGPTMALEGNDIWFFTAAEPNVEVYGSAVISVNIEGQLNVINMAKPEERSLLRGAVPIDVI